MRLIPNNFFFSDNIFNMLIGNEVGWLLWLHWTKYGKEGMSSGAP